MVKTESVFLNVKLPPEAKYTKLYIFVAKSRVEPGEAINVFGQLTDEFGTGIDDANIEIYRDGVYDTTVKTIVATTPDGTEVHGYYSRTYIIDVIGRYKFQVMFKAAQLDSVWYVNSTSETVIVGVGVEPREFYLLNVRAVDVDTGKDIQVSFMYDTLSRKTPYAAKLVADTTVLSFTFPESDGVTFVKWEDESTELQRTVTISADTEIIAYYKTIKEIWVPIAIVIALGVTYFVTRG